jgi:hypothetical protein
MLQVFYLDVVISRFGAAHVALGPPAAADCCSCWGAVERAQNISVCMRVESIRGTSGSACCRSVGGAGPTWAHRGAGARNGGLELLTMHLIWPLTEFEVGPVYKDRLISLKT